MGRRGGEEEEAEEDPSIAEGDSVGVPRAPLARTREEPRRATMLEDQPLDLSVSVRADDYAEVARDVKVEQDQQDRKDLLGDDYGNTALRLRDCFVGTNGTEYNQEREDRTCSEDSDDSCSDNNQKDGGTRSRSRPPGTKPYKKNLMKRYRESSRPYFPMPTLRIRSSSDRRTLSRECALVSRLGFLFSSLDLRGYFLGFTFYAAS